ncbi:MAG: class I SAM-dependent methyltransferase [Gaiellaceae bacterium]
MTSFDDQSAVREQYATEANLQARKALWENAEGDDPKGILWRTIEAWQPRRVLEVGGGEGELAERMQRELGATVSFVDISPRMVELARARGVDAVEGDVQQLAFGDGAFDTVVAAWMLYHVPDLDAGLREIARVLTKGGALVAVTNAVGHIAELRELFAYPDFRTNFNSENGEEILLRHFSAVERYDAVVKATVHERERLVAYRDSLGFAVAEVPEDVELPFVVHGRPTIFVATT